MCMMSKPKMPKVPEPKLPPQPLARQEPVGLKVGREEGNDDTKKLKAKRAGRRKLRLHDKVSTQSAGSAVGAAGGVQTTKA